MNETGDIVTLSRKAVISGPSQSATNEEEIIHLHDVSQVSSSDLNVDSICEGDAKIWLIFDNALRCNYGICYAIINSLSLFQVSGCILLCRGDVSHFKQGYVCVCVQICQVQLARKAPGELNNFISHTPNYI